MPRGRRVRWVSPAKWWAGFAACAVLAVVVAVRRPGPDALSDLEVYLGAARNLGGGGSLYAFVAPNGDAFVYPPVAGLALLPLAALPDVAARVLWTLLQCGQVLLLARVVVRRSPLPVLGRLPRGAAVPAVALVLTLSYPVLSGLYLGQVSLLVTLLALLDAVDLVPRRFQGLLTGLAAAVKLTPLAFVPYLWLTGRRRAAVVALLTTGAVTGGSWLVAPGESARYWGSATVARPYVDLGQADNASLVGLLTRTGWSADVTTVVLVPLTLLVVVAGYLRARDAYRRGQTLAGAVVVGAVVVLVSPISWSHHQVLLVLAAACVVGTGRRDPGTRSAGSAAGWSAGWSVGVVLLTGTGVQAVLLHLWSPGPVLRESGVLLALAIACAVPFRDYGEPWSESWGCSRGTVSTCAEATSPQAGGRRRRAGPPAVPAGGPLAAAAPPVLPPTARPAHPPP